MAEIRQWGHFGEWKILENNAQRIEDRESGTF